MAPPATLPPRPGSLFGLKPYSSTSFRLSSSASLLALRRRHHQRRTQIIRATETTGTTTATAMVPPGESPWEPEDAAPVDVAVAVPVDELVVEDSDIDPVVEVGAAVDVEVT